MARFAIGEKVVCVWDRDQWTRGASQFVLDSVIELPKKDSIYRVHSYAPFHSHIHLMELPKAANWRDQPFFHECGFAPITTEERSTSMDILLKLQNPANHKAPSVTPGDFPSRVTPRKLEPVSFKLDPNWLQIELADVARKPVDVWGSVVPLIDNEVLRAMKWLR